MEGLVDEAAAVKLVEAAGAKPGDVYEKNGKTQLLEKLPGYNNAARFTHWFVLVDLDGDANCAPVFKREHLSTPSALMCFRVAVREIESWFLADRQRLAAFLSIPAARVPEDPESIEDAKGLMVDLARESRRREIREDMVPRMGSGRYIGPAYTSRLIEFVQTTWHPTDAAARSDSLARCLEALRTLSQIALPS